jgi:hypothetical protein
MRMTANRKTVLAELEPNSVDLPPHSEKWLSKIGLADKWRTCSDGCQ